MRLSRRSFAKRVAAAPLALACGGVRAALAAEPDYRIEIGPCTVEASPKHIIRTTGYNGSAPGPLLRFVEGRSVTIAVTNRTHDPEIVHWHGLKIPSHMDGAMEEGSPMIAPGATFLYAFTPSPAGFRWYHTHTYAGKDLNKAQYSGQHGPLLIEPRDNPGRYDAEVLLTLHDWRGQLLASDDGAMNPVYEVSTINGKCLGEGEPVRVRVGQRVLFHILNSSPTEVHWVACAGHAFNVIALDGNAVPHSASVPMLLLAPAERVSATVEMNNPGIWTLGEVRKHIQAAGMGIVVEYSGATGTPQWQQPQQLDWAYERFGSDDASFRTNTHEETQDLDLTFTSKFMGHGAMERWLINGRSYPETERPALVDGRRYRLRMHNRSKDDHPLHLHRHVFELESIAGIAMPPGIHKDTVLLPAGADADVTFLADNPGETLFHCHQQDHMDQGFMMVMRYA